MYTTASVIVFTELPPRARRILVRRFFQLGGEGTTSACAENTSQSLPSPSLKGNYLRVRGEYGWSLCGTFRSGELPPRARRIPPRGALIWAVNGTTSACAENTALAPPTPSFPWNYLRVRGEYVGADACL